MSGRLRLTHNASPIISTQKMLFSDFAGQSRAKTFLAQLAANGRTPHALLFLGPTGSGNLALALAFAQMLQCERFRRVEGGGLKVEGDETPDLFGEIPQSPTSNPPIPQQACGVCNACRKAEQWIHPDIHFSFPTIGTNTVSTDFLKAWRAALSESPYLDANGWLQRIGAENKQGNINKEECNAILKKLSLKIFEGPYKILILWLPEYLGKEGNRLLKLIEEPPEQTIFLLVAENRDLILNTILSRCQLVKVDALSDEEVTEALLEKKGVEAARARQIAFLSGGNLAQAFYLADNPENDDAALLLDWLRKCWRGNGVELVQWTDGFAKLGRENQKQFLHYGLHFMREMLSLVISGNPALRLQPEALQTAQNMAKVLDFEKIARISEILNDNVYYIERNANPKILFLDTSIQLNKILKN